MVGKQGVLAALHEKLKALDAERDKLVTAISMVEALGEDAGPVATVVPRPRHTVQPLPLINYAGMTVRQAVLAYLESTRPEPQKTGHVVTALKNRGMNSDAKSFGTQVYNSLYGLSQGDGPVLKTTDSRWVLR